MRTLFALAVLLAACGDNSEPEASPAQAPPAADAPSDSIEHCLSDDGRSLELELEARRYVRALIPEGSRQPSSWEVGIVQVRVAPDGSQRLMMEYGPSGDMVLWTGSIDPKSCAGALETIEGTPIVDRGE